MLLTLSLAVILFELISHICGSSFFDPFSRWDDVLSIVFVLSIAVLWNARSETESFPARPAPAWLQFCRGIALVIGAYWALAFGTLCLGGVGISLFGAIAAFIGFPPSILFTVSIGALILLALVLICLNPVWVWLSLHQTSRSPEVDSSLRRLGLITGSLLLGIKVVPALLANIAFATGSLEMARSPLVPDYALRQAGMVVITSLARFSSSAAIPAGPKNFQNSTIKRQAQSSSPTPVPADGSKMKVRFACTSEIHDQRYLVLPELVHENFQLAEDLPEAATITGPHAWKTSHRLQEPTNFRNSAPF